MTLNSIIFSKDRAAQLDLLLRSYKHYFVEWGLVDTSIIFTYSNKEFHDGYKKCIEAHPEFLWLDQNVMLEKSGDSFKDLILQYGIKETNPLTMFMVDDLLFKESFSLEDNEVDLFVNNSQFLTLSLRLSSLTDYCYPLDRKMNVPEMDENGTWAWQGSMDDFSYPLSLDGNLFKTDLIQQLVKFVDFNNPNQLESKLSVLAPQLATAYPLTNCYKASSRVLNIVANRVQETFQNRSGNLISASELNKKYLNGEQIKLEPFDKYKNNSPHMELVYSFEK